ncbi:DUF4132 domain-containing protein [Lentzea jiangxiensis]|uniref:WGR domain-containing protein, predicted DNA-binding domain in MolR n=1 Tax=Lentzea jiangxiensis TaxID=641025 RepID=A0A1H0QG28_9PSEU|nr:DUF4132 domain-containing protein [Lentzea jiangxiensis]SDP15628.1 WGR domain-containing protein, predicted DNA-binding domain in MolR [Lentzea jiangxiensis]
MRRWELVAAGSAKFWEVGLTGAVTTVRFGRLGAAGQTRVRELASEAAAEAHVARLVAEKEKKGYRPVAASETPPAGTSRAETPRAEFPRDEDTWVMPAAWLRDVVRRRGLEPSPKFKLDSRRAREFRDWVASDHPVIAEVLEDPKTDRGLAQALRDQLEGRASPLGAAALASVASLHKATVHWLIAEHGLPFAAAAVAHRTAMFFGRGRPDRGSWVQKGYLQPFPDHRVYLDQVDAAHLVLVRSALAVADAETHAAAVEALEEAGTTQAGQMARAFLVPSRHDWFEEAKAHSRARGENWLTLCAVSTLDQFAHLEHRGVTWSPVALHTALHVLGPAIAPFLAEEVDEAGLDADRRRSGLEVLAALPTDEAFTLLLDRAREKYVLSPLLSAMEAFPRRAARLLAARAAEPQAVSLLRAHLETHPDLVVPSEAAALVAEANSRRVPEAPVCALPGVLADPPWTRSRPRPDPVVLEGLPVPAPSESWLPGEREEWLALPSYYNGRDTPEHWTNLAEWISSTGRPCGHGLFEAGPEDLARSVIAKWVPDDSWDGERWGRRVSARFGLDAVAPLLHLAASSPHGSGFVLLPYATAEVATLMADWLVRLKAARSTALSWLERHRETAARLLLPAALGVAGPARHNAEAALRHLHLELGVDVVAVATSVSEKAGAAVRTLVEVDPLDVLPAKLPEIGGWADPRLLPQVLLSDRATALSARAATNLLTTAALSKPDTVYAGLPVAVRACDPASLAEFAWAVFERWQSAGAPAGDGWALTALGRFGDDETVRRLAPLIRAWPGENAHAKAVTGLDVLAQIGTGTALTHLNGIADRVKFKALKARAQEKVAAIAATLGLSRDQLSDRLVPRLGLDDAATLVVDYGPRRFTVGFDEQLKPYVLDSDGKRRKDLPKPGAKDDQTLAPAEHKRFADLKKAVRTIASDQIHRLEAAMITQRTWTAAEFHEVLTSHPLLRHVVRRLVWITDAGRSFRLAEDLTLADANDDELTLPEAATVRVAHPVDLAGELAAWGQVFADYEILQSFPQLGRPVHAFAPGEDLVPQLQEYVGRKVPVGKLLGLTQRGWVRGEPQDAGVECWMTRPLPAGGALVACLDPGIAVGAVDVFPEIAFSSLWFSATGRGAWVAPRDGGPTTFEVDPVTASELLSELESLHA